MKHVYQNTAGIIREKGYHTCKMPYAPLLSSLIIFCKTLCYLNGNFTMCDWKWYFSETNVLHVGQQIWPCLQGQSQPKQQYCNVNKSMWAIPKSHSFDHLKLIFLKNSKCIAFL